MDPNPTPFPGKKQPVKSKLNRKPTLNSKTFSKEPSISRQTRVFGTVRNTNILVEKPASIKPISRRPPEWNPTTRVPIPEPTKKKKNKNKNKSTSSEISKLRSNFSEEEEEVIDEKTPIATVPAPAASVFPSSAAASKYQSAKICSKCRFDRLETSSYWLAQIKLSESVGKHFVSAAFFTLALESKAEPITKLRLELKRYLGRNGNLGELRDWREVCLSYGISKDEKSTTIEKSGSVVAKLETPPTTNQVACFNQETEAPNTKDHGEM